MEQQTTPNRSSSNPVDMMDDLDFRPVTDGLGFHHGNKGQEAVRVAQQTVLERNPAPRPFPREEHPYTAMQKAARAGAPAADFVQDGLSLFYAEKREPAWAPEIEMPSTLVAADRAIRLVAFLLDAAILGACCAFTMAAVGMLTGLEPEAALMAGEADVVGAYAVLFCGYFLLYFTVLEKFQGKSLGKEMLGLRVDAPGGFSLMRAFARSAITFLGLFSLGATAWADLQGAATGTRVVKA